MGVNACPDQQSPGRYPENCCKLWNSVGFSFGHRRRRQRFCHVYAAHLQRNRDGYATRMQRRPRRRWGFLCSRLTMEAMVRSCVRLVKGNGLLTRTHFS